MRKLIFLVAAIAMFSCATKKTKTVENTTNQAIETAQSSNDITGKRWKLIEINGEVVTPSTETVNGVTINHAAAFIMLLNEGNRISASGGCNTISGTFELQPEVMRIRFSQMIMTQMACINQNYDMELAKVLESVDNYSISPDGKTLSLNRARMAPLARFSAE